MSYTLLPSKDLGNFEINCIETIEGFLIKSSEQGILMLKRLLKSSHKRKSSFSISFYDSSRIAINWLKKGFYQSEKTKEYYMKFEGSRTRDVSFGFIQKHVLVSVPCCGKWYYLAKNFTAVWGKDSITIVEKK